MGCIHASAVLLQRELRVADVDADLVLRLLQSHLRLLIFQLAADLVSLRRTVTDRDRKGHTDALIRGRTIKQTAEGGTVSAGQVHRTARESGNTLHVRVLSTTRGGSAIEGEYVHARQQAVA